MWGKNTHTFDIRSITVKTDQDTIEMLDMFYFLVSFHAKT